MPRGAGRKLLIGEMGEMGPPVLLNARAVPPKLRGSVRSARKRSGGRVSGSQVRSALYQIAQRAWLHASLTLGPSIAGGIVSPVNDMSQGAANAQRLTNQVRFVELEYCFVPQTPSAQAYDIVRLIILRDTQPDGNLPTAAEFLCATNTFSCFNPDLVGNQSQPRFIVLANHLVTYQNKTPFTTGQSFCGPAISGRLSLNFTTTYEGNAGTYADIQTNGLYIFAITQTTATFLNGDTCLKYLRM